MFTAKQSYCSDVRRTFNAFNAMHELKAIQWTIIILSKYQFLFIISNLNISYLRFPLNLRNITYVLALVMERQAEKEREREMMAMLHNIKLEHENKSTWV